jgi:radical SAM protein with 4Fe4S-binding SPASM domain
MASGLVSEVLDRVRRRASATFWKALPGADGEIFELRPFHLVLELTNLCNANCVFCPYSQQTRPHERMSEAVFRKAVADYIAMGGGSVDLTPTVGDPLIHPKFVEWVRYLRSHRQIDRITLATNGILLDKHGVEEILDSGISRLNISLAGFDRQMYRRIYRTDAYRKVLANIERLLAANSARSEPVTIFLCLRPDRPEEEVLASPDLQPLLKYHPKIRFAGVFSRSGGQIDELPPGMELAPPVTEKKTLPCRATYMALVVQSNGDVQVCGCESAINAPELVVGNIERQSLQEIWRGERLRALRESFRDGGLNTNCAKCDYYYKPPGFHTAEMRTMAKATRRRLSGETVTHSGPVTWEWQME